MKSRKWSKFVFMFVLGCLSNIMSGQEYLDSLNNELQIQLDSNAHSDAFNSLQNLVDYYKGKMDFDRY